MLFYLILIHIDSKTSQIIHFVQQFSLNYYIDFGRVVMYIDRNTTLGADFYKK